VDNPTAFPAAPIIEEVVSPKSGYLKEIHARTIGETAVELGAGRAKKTDKIDHRVGIMIHHKVGDFVEAGQPLFEIHATRRSLFELARQRILEAHQFREEQVPPLPLFYEVIR
jgi:pyrimidine-nucleoside phosphorylase